MRVNENVLEESETLCTLYEFQNENLDRNL